jgi:hypothetical protein
VVCGFLTWVMSTGPVWGVPGPQGVSIQDATPATSGFVSATVSSTVSPFRTVRFAFTNLYLVGGDFIDLSTNSFEPMDLTGTLLSVSVTASVSDREAYNPSATGRTYASDLTILIAAASGLDPDVSAVPYQLGGFSSVGASLHYFWSEQSPLDEEYFSDSYSFSGSGYTLALERIWLGHGFTSGVGSNFGEWSGTIDFTFASPGGSGVPDASRTALLLAPGTLLLLGLAGRSRRRA